MKLMLCVALCLWVVAVDMKSVGSNSGGGGCCLPSKFALEFMATVENSDYNSTYLNSTKLQTYAGKLAIDFDELLIGVILKGRIPTGGGNYTDVHYEYLIDGKNEDVLIAAETECIIIKLKNATNLSGWRCALESLAKQVPDPVINSTNLYLAPAFNLPFEHEILFRMNSTTCVPTDGLVDVSNKHPMTDDNGQVTGMISSRSRIGISFRSIEFPSNLDVQTDQSCHVIPHTQKVPSVEEVKELTGMGK